jgi:DNA-binding CsgD family transcriptional regulator
MDDQERFAAVVDSVYAAALCDDAWPNALSDIAEFVGGYAAVYLRIDQVNGALLDGSYVGVDPASELGYLTRYGAIDSRIPPALGKPIGMAMTQSSLVDQRAFKRTECYNDHLLPYDLTEVVVSFVEKSATTLSSLSIQRHIGEPEFSQVEAARYVRVLPHLIRALEIRNRLESVRLARSAHMEVLNRLPFGIIFLDDGARIIESSRAADALLRAGHGIRTVGSRVSAEYLADDQSLQRIISNTVRARRERRASGGTVLLRRSQQHAPLHVSVIPAPEQQRLIPAQPTCILVIVDPEAGATPDVALVGRALKLSPSEARLACAMLSGRTLQEVAIELERSVNTCKSQLKAIYAKTGCRNHTELAKCLLQVGLSEGFQIGT